MTKELPTEIHRTQNVVWILAKRIAELSRLTTKEDVSNIVSDAFVQADDLGIGFVEITPFHDKVYLSGDNITI